MRYHGRYRRHGARSHRWKTLQHCRAACLPLRQGRSSARATGSAGAPSNHALPDPIVWMTSKASNSGCPRYRVRLLPASLWARRNASDRVQASKSFFLRQIVCDEYSTYSSCSGPRSRWKTWKPGTSDKWLSRDVHTFSKSASEPRATLKRFIAMNMGCTVAALPSNSLDGACGKDFNAAGVTGVNCREKLSPDEVAAIEAGM